MDIKQVKCFLAVAEHLSFSRAANRLYMSNSAVGYQVASLERDLGVRLFERNSRSVCLTTAGRSLKCDLPLVLEAYDRVTRKALRANEGLTGTLAIGYGGGPERIFLPSVLNRLTERYPNISINLRHCSIRELRDDLLSGRIEIGFAHSPEYRGLDGFGSISFSKEPLVVAMKPGHPLATMGSLSLAELADEPILMMADEVALPAREWLERSFTALGFRPRLSQPVSDLDSLLLLVESGIGLTLVPQHVVDAHPGVKVNAVPMKGLEVEGRILWKTKSDSPLIQLFLRELGVFSYTK